MISKPPVEQRPRIVTRMQPREDKHCELLEPDDILQGDYRLPYLAWLMAISYHYNQDEMLDDPEPPVPAGLNQLNAALSNFVGLFGVDDDLLQAAAKSSPELQTTSESDLPFAGRM